MPPPPIENSNPQKPTQLLAQPTPNPNNKQQAYSLQINDIHLRSGTTLLAPKEPIITEVADAEDIPVNQPVDVPPIVQTTPVPKNPPYPQRLSQVVPPKENPIATNLIDQLKQMTV